MTEHYHSGSYSNLISKKPRPARRFHWRWDVELADSPRSQ